MEKLYQYLWKNKMLGRNEFTLIDGREIRVVDFGRLNHRSGPDFFNAKVMIDSIEWAGNVELHVKASDWMRHGHSSDPAYENVILHVVAFHDTFIERSDGSTIPQLIISLPHGFMALYGTMTSPVADIKCRNRLGDILPIHKLDWLESLAIERIQAKASRICEVLSASGGDWEQAAFITLARALGFGYNSEPFEMLARSLPLKYLHKHSDDLTMLEALLFGQAGLLDVGLHQDDAYYQLLCREYTFLAIKYGLKPIRTIWKSSRPQNSPFRRIAFLAKACLGGFSMLRKIVEHSYDADAIAELFSWELGGYWNDHSSFGNRDLTGGQKLSRSSINLLMINFAAPLMFAYARMTGDEYLEGDALKLLESLPAERNYITREWDAVGMKSKNAYNSQALIQLRKEYCDANKCLYCRFGYRHLKTAYETPDP